MTERKPLGTTTERDLQLIAAIRAAAQADIEAAGGKPKKLAETTVDDLKRWQAERAAKAKAAKPKRRRAKP